MESGANLGYFQPDDKAFYIENLREIHREIQALDALFNLEKNLVLGDKDIERITAHFSVLLFRYQMIPIEDKTDRYVKMFSETLQKAQTFLDYLMIKVKTLLNTMISNDTLLKLDQFNFGQKIYAPSMKTPTAVEQIVKYFKTFCGFQSEQARFLTEEKITKEMVEKYQKELGSIKDGLQSLEVIICDRYPAILPAEVARDYVERGEMTMGDKARQNIINAIGDLQGIIPKPAVSDNNNAERPLKARRKEKAETAVVQSFKGLSVEDKKDKEDEAAILKAAMAMRLGEKDDEDNEAEMLRKAIELSLEASSNGKGKGNVDYGQLTFQNRRKLVPYTSNQGSATKVDLSEDQTPEDETSHTMDRKRGLGG